MRHHTKDKGDLAVAKVIADAAKTGIKSCVPITEHLPFDLILVDAECQLRRVQVRYAKARKNRMRMRLRSSYSWKGGCRVRLLDRTKIDGFPVYCPDTDRIYYLRTDEIPADAASEIEISLADKAKWVASKYLGAERLFTAKTLAPVAQMERASVF